VHGTRQAFALREADQVKRPLSCWQTHLGSTGQGQPGGRLRCKARKEGDVQPNSKTLNTAGVEQLMVIWSSLDSECCDADLPDSRPSAGACG